MSGLAFMQGVQQGMGNMGNMLQMRQNMEIQKEQWEAEKQRRKQEEEARKQQRLAEQQKAQEISDAYAGINRLLSSAKSVEEQVEILDEFAHMTYGLGWTDVSDNLRSRAQTLLKNKVTMESHASNMKHQDLEYFAKQTKLFNENDKQEKIDLGEAWHDMGYIWQSVTEGDPERFLDSLPQWNRNIQHNPEKWQTILELPKHRIPKKMEVAQDPETGEYLITVEIENTKTKTTGPMTEKGTADPDDEVVTTTFTALNNFLMGKVMDEKVGSMGKGKGQGLGAAPLKPNYAEFTDTTVLDKNTGKRIIVDKKEHARLQLEKIYNPGGGPFASMPEGTKVKMQRAMHLANVAIENGADTNVVDIIANLLNTELPQVEALEEAKTDKQLDKATKDFLSLFMKIEQYNAPATGLSAAQQNKQKTPSSMPKPDARANMPSRPQGRSNVPPDNDKVS